MATADTLAASLSDAAILIERLDQALSEERSVLGQRDVERLATVVKHKCELLDALERNSKERRGLLASHNVAPTEAGFKQYLATLPAAIAGTLETHWNNVELKLEQCRDANLVNGKILQRSRQQVQALLEIMRGQDNSPRLYNDSGTATPVPRQQPLAKA